MRRTYKSKKEIGGGLDPRDVIHTMDSKSSIFDAFYIQNIKQTKRELSVYQSSNQSVASNKVRKRKYVKRIKEQEPIIQESSTSAYLTPDKSIRVNKAPDLFDQLLNSSMDKNSMEPVFSLNKNSEKSRKSKVNSKPRSYQKRKSLRKKMVYSDCEGTDSDDFSCGENNKTKNMSNILRHELQIEKENIEPKPVDSSIDNLVNNLSIFNNNNKAKDCTFKNSTQSNSPLCSTPFLSKYRGKSIYNFSPISINLNESSEDAIVSEGSINGNEGTKGESVITKDLEIDKKSFYSNSKNNSIHNQVTSPILKNKEANCSEKIGNSKDNLLAIEILESTEIEPFLGFSNVAKTSEVDSILNKYKDIKDSLGDQTNTESIITSLGLNNTEKEDKFLGFSKVSQDIQPEATLNKYKDFDFSSKNQYNEESNLIDSNLSMVEKEEEVTLSDSPYNISVDSDTANSELMDDESLYDTCNSEDFEDNTNKSHKKELVVVVEKLNDSIFQRFYNKISDIFNESNEDVINTSNSKHCYSVDHTNVSIGEYEYDPGYSYDDNDQDYKAGSETDSIDEINEKGSDSDNIDEANESKSDSSDNKDLEEENCISFVTIRKRNCLSNNSFIFTLENSITSGSSADFEKTVLSNDTTSQPNYMTMSEIGVEESNITDNITRVDNNKTLVESTDNVNIEMLPISAPKNCESIRKSVRKSSLRPKRVSAPRKSTIDIYNKTNNIVNNNIINRESTESVVSSIKEPDNLDINNRLSICEARQAIVLQPGKRWERSLSIYRRMTTMADNFDQSILDEEPLDGKGRKYRQSVIATMEMQDYKGSLHNESIQSHRSILASKPHRSTIKIIRESNSSRTSLCSTTISEDLQGYLTEDCDDTIIELSKLSIADSEHEVTILNNFHDTSNRITTARDYVLRRCNQADVILFDECYPDTVLKNCRKIGEGVYGEVFLWRAGDGRARVLKIVPIAGHVKVNGEEQKDYHEIISEIVIAMELSALRAPIPEIERHLDEGKGVETLDLHSVVNATDVFNQVLAAHCVIGSYPSRLLDLWELYDETKGSENDNPAVLPTDQQFLVLELANAGQDLESYQFNNAEQAYALFQQIAFGLAVGEEAFQFEHRDLHWGNVLIAPTDQKYATFVLRGRSYRVPRRGVSGTIIDYSLSRVSLPLGGDAAALYNDLSSDDALFDAVGDYQFQVYRLMRDKLGNDWKNFEPYTNILWLHYTVDKMITALRYTRTNTKIHKHYITKLKEIKNSILEYGSAVQYVLTDNEL